MTDRNTTTPLATGDMYSTAFQFYSHIDADVDPRTGMFSANVDLSTGKGNRLRGPHFSFRLSYDALDVGTHQGFGDGWRLALTEVDLTAQMVTLSSGDSHRYQGLLPDASATFPDRKLDSFSLVRPDSTNNVIVEHITGMIEHLGPMQGTSRYLRPVRIVGPSGDAIQLHWGFAEGRYVLQRVSDNDGQTLLSIDYTATSVAVIFHLGHSEMILNFSLRGSELFRIAIPLINQLNTVPTVSGDEAIWEFGYAPLENGIRLLTSVVFPDGSWDEVVYDKSALRLPSGAPVPYMPAVSRRTRRKVSDQSVIQRSDYAYNQFGLNNFYGYPVVSQWENRNDQLLHLTGQGAFNYGSKEIQYDGSGAKTTEIERNYNQFHLMVREKTTRGLVVQDVVTEYGHIPNRPFSQQPKTFQLPHKVTSTRYDIRSPDIVRNAYVESTYDAQGNIEYRYDSATDVTERTAYFPPEGEVDGDIELCPPDPIGLVRRLKSRTTEPGEKGGPVRSTHYRYTRVPMRQSELAWTRARTYYVQACEETSLATENGVTIELERNEQNFIVDQGEQHGSIDREMRWQDGLTETRAFIYDDAEDTVTKHTKCTTHDGIEMESSETLYLLSGLVKSTRDAQGNVTLYSYDDLNRRIAEVFAPDDEDYKAETRWNYQLSMSERWVQRIGLTGLPHRVWIDERGQVVRRDEPLENGELAMVDQLEYDVFGQLVREVETDRLPGRLLQRESRFEYDDWGMRALEIAPDGSRTVSQTSLVVSPDNGEVLTQTLQWQTHGENERTGWQATCTDAAERRVRTQSGVWGKEDERIPTITTAWVYDGCGRCLAMTETFEAENAARDGRLIEQVTRQTWDAYDRLTTTTLPDGTVVKRAYAPGHDGEVLARLSVVPPGETTERELGTRTWDGLGRLVTEHSGSLSTRYAYIPGQVSSSTRTMPDGSEIHMNYDPRLREALMDSTLTQAGTGVSTVVTEAAYEKRIGLPSRVTTPGGSMAITLDYLGRMTSQTVALSGTVERECHVVVTPGGLEVEKTGVDGVRQIFDYDNLGRLIIARDEDLEIELAYDALSRPERRTAKTAGGRSVTQSFEYDAMGRVSTQIWQQTDGTDTSVRKLVLSWRPDDKVAARRWYDRADTLVRTENMDYDARGRLTDHVIEAEGDELPQDEMQQPYVRQQFEHDCIDNLLKVTTTRLDGQINVTEYGYDSTDIDRLDSVRNSLPGYPGHGTPLTLDYDANGNLIDDGQGRALEWDGMSRLASVTLPDGRTIRYVHGPDSRVSQVEMPEKTTYRYREDGALAFELNQFEERRYIRTAGAVVAETRIAASIREVLLLGTDPQGSVITESSAN